MEGVFPGDEVRTARHPSRGQRQSLWPGLRRARPWTDGPGVSTLESGEEVDVLYFVGCYASFDKRNQQVAKNFIAICRAAGIRVGILGKEEKCCGEPPRKLGNEYLYQTLAKANIERIQHYGVKRIVTTCPHCYNTLARDYKDLGLDLPVEHYSTYVGRLSPKRLKLKPQPFDFTYHDSCYLGATWTLSTSRAACWGGRREDCRDGPSGYDSFCCGGGGGRILAEEKLGGKISEARVRWPRPPARRC